MDEEDRQTKLQAGKEALLAFQQQQKKRGKRKKKKTTDTTDSFSSSLGAHDSSEATHSGNVSPIPFDNSGVPLAGGGVASTTSLPTANLSKDRSQTHSLPPSTGLVSVDSGLGTDIRSRIERSDTNGTPDMHDSPVQPDGSVVADLERQLRTAHATQQQLQNELNQVLENQLSAVNEARREVANSYEIQLTTLQQSLVQTEGSLHTLEKQLSEANVTHSMEMDNLLKQQEDIREVLLGERDQKHAAHIARLTDQLTSQEQLSGVVQLEADEQEAERLKQIKEKMRELHEQEKERLASEHKQEKEELVADYQKQVNAYRQHAEQLANAKVQEVHTQFMSAHQTLLEQKNAAESSVAQLRGRLEEMQSQIDDVQREKSTVEEKYHSFLESHTAEVELMRQNSSDLDKRLSSWKEKASNLEARLERSSADREVDLDQLRCQQEDLLQKTKLECEEKLRIQQSLIEEYQNRLQAQETNQRQEIQALQNHHKLNLEETKAKHESEVSLLEENLTDTSFDKASLEVAEEHMKGLQTQLDAYRTQESNFQAKLTQLQQQHAEDLELLKQQVETQKTEEISEISSKFLAQIESLEEDLTALQNVVDAKQSQSQDREMFEALKSKHQKELLEVQTTLHEGHELSLQSLRQELVLSHTREVEYLKQQQRKAADTLRKQLETEWLARVEAAKEEVATELEMAKDVEIDQLVGEHQLALKQLRQQLTETETSDVAKAEARVMSMETELQILTESQVELQEARKDLLSQLEFAQRQLQESDANLSRVSGENSQLAEQCQGFQNEVKSLEVDLSIARNTSEQSQVELEQWKARVEELQGQVGELEAVAKTNTEQSQKVLELLDQLAVKNVQIANLQSEMDSLNTEVFTLTQKCQQHVALSESFKKQLEGSSAATDEIVSLQKQLSELLHVKEDYSRMQESIGAMEESARGKASEIGILRAQLSQSNQQLLELEAHWSSKYDEAITASSQEIQTLKQELASHDVCEAELRQQLEHFQIQLRQVEPRERESAQIIASLNQKIQELQGSLDYSSAELDQLKQDKQKLEEDLKDTHGILDELAGDDHEPELLRNYERLQQDYESLRAEKDQLGDLQVEQKRVLKEQQNSWESKVEEKERTIQELRVQLSARESAFTEIQNEFGRQLTESEMREQSLLQRMQESKLAHDQLGSVLGEKSVLESSLSQARHSLTEKLQEKAAVEKELNYHRIELERRLGEKQRLEELLFEKSRLEHELHAQKDHLQEELSVIESKLKLKEVEMERERSDWMDKVQKTELEHLENEQRLRQQHSSEISRVNEDLSLKYSTEMSQLNEGLNRQHEKHVSVLQEKHQHQLAEVETGLRQKHDEAIHSLQTHHKKELEEVRAQLANAHQQQLENLEQELEERRKKEVSTIKEVLEREKEGDLAALQQRLKAEHDLKLCEMEESLKELYREKYDQDLAREKEHLEQTHQLHMDALTAGIGEDNRQQFQLQLEHIQQVHEQELEALRSDHEAAFKENSVAARAEMERQLQEARLAFEQELSFKLAEKDRNISTAIEQRLAESNSEWEERMSQTLGASQAELVSKYEGEIEALKTQHSEEVENALKSCQKWFDEQMEALKAEQWEAKAASLAEHEEVLRKQHLEELETLRELQEKKHEEEIEKLVSQLDQLQAVERDLCTREEQHTEELETLRTRVGDLEGENKDLIETHRLQLDRLKSEQERGLQEVEKTHQAEVEALRDAHSGEVSTLTSDYQSKLVAVREECDVLEDRLKQENTSAQVEMREHFEREMLAKESEFREEMARIQTQCEQRVHEAELRHLQEATRLNEELQGKLSDSEIEHEKKYQALLRAHEEEKTELVGGHERDIREMEVAHSRKLLELKTEVSESLPGATAEDFARQLERELGLQREMMENQHGCQLRLQESKLRGEFAVDLEKQRVDVEETYTDMLAQVHTEAALKTATQLEQQRLQFVAEKERVLSEQTDWLVAGHEQQLLDMTDAHEQALVTQREKMTSEYEAKLSELENVMAGERKKQITLIKERHSEDLSEQEKKIRAQLETDHLCHVHEVVAGCEREKQEALEDLRKELETRVEEVRSQLVGEHEAELETRVEEVRNQLVGEHEAELETRVEEVRSQLVGEHEAELETRVEEVRNQLVGEHEAELETRVEEVRSQLVGEHEAELETRVEEVRNQLVGEHKAELETRVEEVRSQLVAEHMTKFRDMTEKLQHVHEAELGTVRQEQLVAEGRHLEQLDHVREELESQHQLEISQLSTVHRSEVERLQQQFELLQREHQGTMEDTVRSELSKLNEGLELKLSQLEQERGVYVEREAALRQEAMAGKTELEKLRETLAAKDSELADLKRQHGSLTERLATREHEVEQQLVDLRETIVKELRQQYDQQLKSLEQSLAEKLQVMENDLELATSENESLLRLQESLKSDNVKATDALQRQIDKNEQLESENVSLRGRLSEVDGQLGELHSQSAREHREDSKTLTMIHDEMRALRAERDVLQSTVAALQGAIASSLQLAALVDSVMARQTEERPPATEGEGSPNLTGSELSTTSDSHKHTTSDWTILKQTPSMDSGLASQQASILAGTLVGTPADSTPPPSQEEEGTPTPTPSSVDVTDVPLPDLTILPLDATSREQPPPVSKEQASPHLLVGGASMYERSQFGVPSMLSVSFIDDTQQQETVIDPSLLEHSATDPLSIVPLMDSTLDSSQYPVPILQPGVTDLATLQGGMSHFHDSISTLLQNYITLTAQASETQTQLAATQAQLAATQEQLRQVESSVREQLEQTDGEVRGRLERAEGRCQQAEAELMEKREQLVHAETKIKTLVEQLEHKEGDKLESELVEEMQNLIEQFKAKEVIERELKEQLGEGQRLLTERETHLLARDEELGEAQAKIESLRRELGDISHALEEQKQETGNVQEQYSDLEQELEATQRNCTSARQECDALREANRELRTLRENLECSLRNLDEQKKQLSADFVDQLQAKDGEIRELADMRNRLAAKEEIEEELVSERDDLSARLAAAEHQLANYQSVPFKEQQGRIQELVQREDQLSRDLRDQVALCESLRARLHESEASLNETGQEKSRVEQARSQLEVEVVRLREELQRRDTALQHVMAERTTQEKAMQASQEQLSHMRQQLEEVSTQREKAEVEMEEMRSQISGIENELQKQHQSHESERGSLLAALASKEEDTTAVRTHLEDKVASLTDQLREKEEDAQLQVDTLEHELSVVRGELTQKCSQVEVLRNDLQQERERAQREVDALTHTKETAIATLELERDELSGQLTELQSEIEREREDHARELSDIHLSHLEGLHSLREELEARHAGEVAYLRLHHREQVGELQARHQEEVERIVSEHEEALRKLDEGPRKVVWVDEESAAESLLLRIAELAPILQQEATEVKDLCKLTGQPLPEPPEAAPSTDSLLTVVDSLKQLLQEIRTTKSTPTLEDWRRELIQAVEQIIDHEHGLFTSVTTPGEKEKSEEHIQKQTSLLNQLHSSDRQSLLTEIHQLRTTLESLESEQTRRQQQEASNKHHQIAQLETRNSELESAMRNLTSANEVLGRELSEAQGDLSGLEDSMGKAASTITSLQQELQASCAREAELQRALSEGESSSQLHLEEVRREHSTAIDAEKAARVELRESLGQEVARNHQLSIEMAELRRRLETAENSLKETEGHDNTLQEHIGRLQGELEHAREVARQSEEVLREKESEMEHLRAGVTSQEVDSMAQVEHYSQLLDSEQRATTTLRARLETKEAELTRTMDQFLQEKMATAKAHGELTALRGRLNRAQTEVESLQRQLSVLKSDREGEREAEELRRQSRQLQTELQAARVPITQRPGEGSVMASGEVDQRYRELQQQLHQQLNKSTLLKTALDREVSDGMDLRQRLELLLKQEHLQAVAHKSLQTDRDRLERETRRLQREAEEWKQLAQSSPYQVASPGKVSPSPSALHQQSAIITELQRERLELHNTISRLQGHISDLEEERTQDKDLLIAQSAVRQELESKHEELQSQVAQLEWQLAESLKRLSPSTQTQRSTMTHDPNEAKVVRLYAQYRQAETHRKALVFQKRYLQCQIDAFYQTQQAALMMMADMGAPVDFEQRPPHSKYPRPYAKFRAVGCMVRATLRFQYMRRRKLQHLRAKVSKISSSHKVDPCTVKSPVLGLQATDSKPIGVSPGIQTVLSAPPRKSGLPPSPQEPFSLTTTSSSVRTARKQPHSSPPKLKLSSTGQRSTDSKHSTSGGHSKPAKSQPTVSGTGPQWGESHEARDDPQLVAYIKGLERLQARLSKTKL